MRRMLVAMAVMFISVSALATEYKRVLLVTFDGVGVQNFEADPTLRALFADGYYVRARTTMPPSTLPAHASLVTGLAVRDGDGKIGHGIGWNRFDPKFGTVGMPTIFHELRQHGWTVTAIVGKEKLRHVLPPRVVNSLSVSADLNVAFVLAAQALQYDRSFVFLHIGDPDAVGHAHGWESVEYGRALTEASLGLKRMLDALRVPSARKSSAPRDLLVVFTADHGGRGKSHPQKCLSCYIIPFAVRGRGVTHYRYTRGTVASIWDVPATILQALEIPVPETWRGRPVSLTGVRDKSVVH